MQSFRRSTRRVCRGFERYGWYGVAAAAQTPREIVAKVNAAIVKAVETPALRSAFINQGMLPKSAPSAPRPGGLALGYYTIQL